MNFITFTQNHYNIVLSVVVFGLGPVIWFLLNKYIQILEKQIRCTNIQYSELFRKLQTWF